MKAARPCGDEWSVRPKSPANPHMPVGAFGSPADFSGRNKKKARLSSLSPSDRHRSLKGETAFAQLEITARSICSGLSLAAIRIFPEAEVRKRVVTCIRAANYIGGFGRPKREDADAKGIIPERSEGDGKTASNVSIPASWLQEFR
jgi:hypothetical protein